MGLIIVTYRKEKSIQKQLSEVNCERYDYRDFLEGLKDRESFTTNDTYILLAFREKALLGFVEKHILEAGILRKQIIHISEWDNIKADEMKKVENCIYGNDHYDGILMGMSHLKDGIMLSQLKGNYVKIGIPSIDIFYISRIIQLMVNEDKLDGCRQILFELPYYIFNWDISKSAKMVERFQIAYYFGEYHHFGKDDDEQMQLRHMSMFNDIMKRKMIQKGDCVKKCSVSVPYKQIEQNKQDMRKTVFKCLMMGIRKLPEQRKLCEEEYSIWSKLHSDTIEENQIEWRKMIKLLTQAYPTIKIFVTVFPHSPYFRKCHTNEIRRMRSVFYKSVKCNSKINIFDNFNYYLPFCCFSDECHLNELGAYIYSGVLNTKL